MGDRKDAKEGWGSQPLNSEQIMQLRRKLGRDLYPSEITRGSPFSTIELERYEIREHGRIRSQEERTRELTRQLKRNKVINSIRELSRSGVGIRGANPAQPTPTSRPRGRPRKRPK